MSSIKRALVLSVALAGVATGLTQLSAQEEAPPTRTLVAAPAGPQHHIIRPQEDVVLERGQSLLISARFALVDMEGASANEEVCAVTLLADPNDEFKPHHVQVAALIPGITTVTLQPADPYVEPLNFRIIVVEDKDLYKPLEELVAAEMPDAKIRIIPIPTSNKVLVTGEVGSEADGQAIVDMIANDNLDAESIVTRLTYRADRFASLEQFIATNFPGSEVKVIAVPGAKVVVLKGTVMNDDQSEAISTMMTNQQDREENSLVEEVINLLQIADE